MLALDIPDWKGQTIPALRPFLQNCNNMKKHATTPISRRQSVLTRLLPVLLLLLLPAVGGMTGCAEDDELSEPQNLYNVKGNEWIYEQMVHHYYWTDELPTKEKLNYNEKIAD